MRMSSVRPVGVNLLVMAQEPVDMASVLVYEATLAAEVKRLGVELGRPWWHRDGLADKLEAV
jgi:hypothetical protein